MTPVILLEELKKRIENATKDIVLQVKGKRGENETRQMQVFKMQLPNKEEQTKQVPYALLQVILGKDEQTPGSFPKSICKVRIVIVLYDENGEDGKMALLNIISDIRASLIEFPIVGRQFEALKPLEYLIYEEDTSPYHLGEMLIDFSLPEINRKI